MRALALAVLLAACSGKDREPPAPEPPRSTTTWVVRITDGVGGPAIGGRIWLTDAQGEPVRIGTLDVDEFRQASTACRYAADVAGTWDGIVVGRGVAELPIGVDACAPGIPYGRYHISAWRGPEHDRWDGEVDLGADRGRVTTAIALPRVASPAGVAADLHVHAAASIDSRLPNEVRAIAQAAAGVQVLALSDHNAGGDLALAIRAAGLETVLASIPSIELGGYAHVGLYPWQPAAFDPAAMEVATADELFAFGASAPGAPVIQLNHPRLRWVALYDDHGWDGRAWPPPFALGFDAVEVLSGDSIYNAETDRPLDQSIDDFYTLIDHGFLVTAVGNSDTHHTNGIRDAVTRNYVELESRRWPLDTAAFVDAIRHRRSWTTSGPILEVAVRGDGGGDVAPVGPGGAITARRTATVEVALRQASWVVTDTLRIRAGGRDGPRVIRALPVPHGVAAHAWTIEVPIERGRDTWIGVDAIGDTPLPPEITGTYLWEDGRPGGAPAALINPILVDADADGWWTRGDGRVRIDAGRAIGGRASLRRPVIPSAPRPSAVPLQVPAPPAP
jgi:hypothetical protein